MSAAKKSEFDLDAFLDGGLDPLVVAEIALSVRRDEAQAAAVGRAAADAALIRAALAARAAPGGEATLAETQRPGDRFLARRLADRLRSAEAAKTGMGHWAPRLAAAVALVLGVGLAAGYFGAGLRTDRDTQAMLAAAAVERASLRATIDQALESRASGETVAWRAPAGLAAAAVTPVRTYRSVSGHWCREYYIESDAALPAPAMRATACRDDGGRWLPVRREF